MQFIAKYPNGKRTVTLNWCLQLSNANSIENIKELMKSKMKNFCVCIG